METQGAVLKPFRCINCSRGVNDLYKKYSASVIKLTKCKKCHEVADKYVEFEEPIVLLDLALLSREAFCHAIYNAEFKLHWKIWIVLVLLESFATFRQKVSDLAFIENMAAEKGFYICVLQNLTDTVFLYVIFQIIHILPKSISQSNHFLRFHQAIDLWKAIVVATLSKFFLLPILIWRENTTEFGIMVHYLIIKGYHCLSLAHAHSVVANTSITRSTFVVLLALMVKQIISPSLVSSLQNITY